MNVIMADKWKLYRYTEHQRWKVTKYIHSQATQQEGRAPNSIPLRAPTELRQSR